MANTRKKTTQKVQDALCSLERRLHQELGERLGMVTTTTTDRPTELLDRAADGEIDYMSALSAQAGSATLEEVEMALEKLRDGTYGICSDCGERIPARRLKARPFAVLCVHCKEIQERGGFFEGPSHITTRPGTAADVDLNDDDRPERKDASLEDVFRDSDLNEIELSELF